MFIKSAKFVRFSLLACLWGASSMLFAETIVVKLDGYQVVSTQNSTGQGRFQAKIDRANQYIEYNLAYKNLKGDILQSHIHFGRPGTNGGIVTFLCTNLGNDPAASPAPNCPGPNEGEVTGIIEAEDIKYLSFPNVFPATQLFDENDFDALVNAIDAGAAYVVIHTTAQPPGELRGNVKQDD